MPTVSRYLMLEQQNRVARYGNILAVWGVLLGIASILAALFVSRNDYLSVPFEDQWAVIQELADHQGTYTPQLLWAFHNEHRQPIAKLLMTADLEWFRGRNISLYVEIYLIQIVHFLAWLWLLRRASAWPGWMVAAGSGLAAFALFWITQYQSFLNPFGVSILPACVFATLSIGALLIAIRQSKLLPFLLPAAAAAAFISESSLANGLLLWPLLLVAAIRFRVRWHWVAMLAAVAVVAIAGYLVGFQSPSYHAKPSESLKQPLVVLEYILVYFGAEWRVINVTLGKAIALAGIVTASFCYVREFLRRTPEIFPFSLLSLCMFLLGTAGLTALGRINLTLIQATASRYQSNTLLFWLCLALYLMDLAYRHRLRSAMLTTAGVLLTMTAILPSLAPSLDAAEEMKTRIVTGALPLIADVKDDEAILDGLVVVPELAFQDRPFLRKYRTAMYADPRYELLGQPLTSRFQIAPPNRCFGEFDTSRQIATSEFPGWQLTGWSWDHLAMKPVSQLVAVTDNDRISGIGITIDRRVDVPKVYPEISDLMVGWRLYLQGAAPAVARVKVYGVVDEGKTVCLVTPAFALPRLKR